MARYTVLRMMIFFGFLCALWLLGLQGAGQRWWLLGLSALGSMVVSYFVLQGPRAQFSANIAHRVDEHARRAEPGGDRQMDQAAEDSEVGQDSEVGEGSAGA
jgi:hypothetical protein